MKYVEKDMLRRFGNDLVGVIPWGTHLCQFYESKQDLIDILVPYFAEGLRSNEFCMWVTSQPLEVKEATEALREVVPDLGEYVRKGQIEIISYNDWYLLGGKFDSSRVLQGWVEKEKVALKRGFEGLRLTGNTLWVERTLWKSFVDYEEVINSVIGAHRMIALCTYCLTSCSGTDVVDVVRNHVGTLIKQVDKWYLVEDAARRKAVNSALKLSEQKYSALFENMQDGFAYHKVLFDEAGRPVDYVFLEVNDAFERLTGLKRENIRGKRVTQVLPGIEKDPANWISVYGRVALTGEPVKFENYSEALHRWYFVSAYSPENGYFVATFEDVTERKKSEETLVNEKSMLSGIMENTGVMLAYFDPQFNFVAVNSAYAKGSRHTVEDLIGKNHFVLFPNEENQAIFEKVRDTGESVSFFDKPFEFADQPKRGVTYWDWKLAPVKDESGHVQGLILSLFETTQRKKAEEKILLAKKEWERTFDSMPDLVAILDTNYQIVRANRSMAQRLGINPDQCIGLNCFKCVHRLDGPPSFCPHSLTIADGKEHIAEVHEDNLGGDFLVSTTPLFDVHGQIIGSIHVARDITERKRMEQELFDTLEASQRRQSEVSALLKASKAVLQHRKFKNAARLIFDSCKGLLGAAAGYVALLNEDTMRNDVVYLDSGGLPCTVDPSLPMPIRGLRAEAYVKEKAVYDNDFSNSDWVKLMPEGHMRLKNVLFAPLTIDNKTVGLIGVANKPEGFTEHDAKMALSFGQLASIALNNSRMLESLKENEKKLKEYNERLEELVEEKTKQLKDIERFAAIGQTAGMIGHDIRNPLQSIDGAIYLAKGNVESLPDGSEEKKELEEILDLLKEQVSYIDHMIADLQDFARTPTPQFEEINIQQSIRESLSMVEIPENIKVNVILSEDPLKLTVDLTHMKRVFVNLIKNAVQSMPDGGELTLMVLRKDNEAWICVEDTGVGIAEEIKPKLFTPLFTTKSKGQGFGLAVCKKLIGAQGGEISFDSEEGKGSTFTIKLPLKREI